MPKQPKVLDLGCGAGYESRRLHNLGASVVGIDISEKSLSIAKERNPEIKFYKHSLLDDYSHIGKFDAIACIGVLLHIEEQDLKLAFENMSKALNDNGYLMINVNDRTEKTLYANYNNQRYARNFLQYTKEDLMKYAGDFFKIVKEYPADEKHWKTYFLQKI